MGFSCSLSRENCRCELVDDVDHRIVLHCLPKLSKQKWKPASSLHRKGTQGERFYSVHKWLCSLLLISKPICGGCNGGRSHEQRVDIILHQHRWMSEYLVDT